MRFPLLPPANNSFSLLMEEADYPGEIVTPAVQKRLLWFSHIVHVITVFSRQQSCQRHKDIHKSALGRESLINFVLRAQGEERRAPHHLPKGAAACLERAVVLGCILVEITDSEGQKAYIN